MSQYAPESVKSRDHVKGFHNQTDAISTEGVSLLGIDPATNQLYSDGKRPVLRDRIVTLGALNGFFCRACRHWHMRRLLLTFCFGATLHGPPPTVNLPKCNNCAWVRAGWRSHRNARQLQHCSSRSTYCPGIGDVAASA